MYPTIRLICAGGVTGLLFGIAADAGASSPQAVAVSGSWQAPVRIDTSGSAVSPLIAVDPNGNATVIWSQNDASGNPTLWSSRYTSGLTWAAPLLVSSGDNTSEAAVAIDPRGNAIAVWVQADVGVPNEHVWANRFVAGDTWGSAATIETHSVSSDGHVRHPQIAFDPNGNAAAVWVTAAIPTGVAGAVFTHRTIWSNRYTSGQGWAPHAVRISGTDNNTNDPLTRYNISAPQVAMDQNGNALAIWEQFTGTPTSFSSPLRYLIWSGHYTPAGGWESAQLIESELTDVALPQIAMDASGNALALWQQSDSVGLRVRANRFTPDKRWGLPRILDNDPSQSPQGAAQIAVDPNGNAIAVWPGYAGSINNIWASHRTAGGDWEAAQIIETESGGTALPAVAMDSNGNGFATWAQLNGTSWTIRANRYVAGAGWSTATPIETDAGSPQSSGPQPVSQIKFDATGKAIAVWMVATATAGTQVWATRFQP
jgi:hypothetical protein